MAGMKRPRSHLVLLVLLGATISAVFANPPVTAGLAAGGSEPVLAGIDVLVREQFARLDGRRVGLITNQTGIDRDGISTIERLHDAPQVELVALFSPEHGLLGRLDIPVIGDSTHVSGVRVFSLYGETRQPTRRMLQNIDTLLFDIQDIGTRYYTYIATLGLAMQAAAQQDIRFMVLDRPNPITGAHVSGPVSDPGRESFTAFHTLPVRHGMTVGELARMFETELGLEMDLEVVRIEGWNRSDYFDRTGLRWVNPSPNMRSLTQALLYSGIGLLETTNVSVGRGTDTPFEVIGAPWLDGEAFALLLNQLELPGVVFVPVRFTPDASRFEGVSCGGVNIIITDRDVFEPVRTGLAMASALRRSYPDDWDVARFDRLLVNQEVFAHVRQGARFESIEPVYGEALARFLERRARFLLYP